jgi:small conductance mechanosensitive channel
VRYEGHVIVPELPAETPSPAISAGCQTDTFCDFVYRHTGQGWLAEGGYYLLVKPLRIVLIVIFAIVVRHILNRMLTQLTHRASEHGSMLLRQLQPRGAPPRPSGARGAARSPASPTPPPEASQVGTERRRQRAQALSSVLRSTVSVVTVTVAVMLVLGELGVNLAPLLASAGIVGVALGFGAQNLVKDFIAGMSMLLEDQYGVGDLVDVGQASGTVEAVGLRTTTIRDARGVLWYIRNGEIVRVGNRSQGWALVVVDVPVGFAGVEEATAVLRAAADAMTTDPEYAGDLLDAPEVLGVEQITLDGAVVRTTARTPSDAQWRVARELRRRLTEAIEEAGITTHLTAGRVFVRPSTHDIPTQEDSPVEPRITEHGLGGPT